MNYRKDQKKWLNRYIKNKEYLEYLYKRLEVLDQRITLIRSPRFSDMPRGSIPVTPEDLIANKVELEGRITRMRKRGLIMKEEISDWIHTLKDPRYIELLENFYIHGLSIKQTARIMGYTERHIFNIYKAAIEALPWPDQQS